MTKKTQAWETSEERPGWRTQWGSAPGTPASSVRQPPPPHLPMQLHSQRPAQITPLLYYYKIISTSFPNMPPHSCTPYDAVGEVFKLKLYIITRMLLPYQPQPSRPYSARPSTSPTGTLRPEVRGISLTFTVPGPGTAQSPHKRILSPSCQLTRG